MNIKKALLYTILPIALVGSLFVMDVMVEGETQTYKETDSYEVSIPASINFDTNNKQTTFEISGTVYENKQLWVTLSSKNDFNLVSGDNKIAYTIADNGTAIENKTVFKFPNAIISQEKTQTFKKELTLSITGERSALGTYSDTLTFTFSSKNCVMFSVEPYIDGTFTTNYPTYSLKLDGETYTINYYLNHFIPTDTIYEITDIKLDEDNYLYLGPDSKKDALKGTVDADGVDIKIDFVTKTKTVKFDVNSEYATCDVTSQKAAPGYAYGELPTPVRYGYKFDGWYTEKDGGTLVTEESKCTDDITLYAHWSELSCKLVLGNVFYGMIPDEATSVVFTSEVAPNGTNTTDLTLDKDGSVVGWLDGTTFKVSTQTTEKKIVFNENSSLMFSSGGVDDKIRFTSITFDNVDTSKVTKMSRMFAGCSNLTTLDLSQFDTSNVTDMYWMFKGCTILTDLNISSFNTSSVTTMQGMFNMCDALEKLDLRSFNTSNVENVIHMFSGDSKLSKIYVTDKFDLSKVTASANSENMFYGCNKLPNFDSTIINKTNAKSVADGGYLYVNPIEVTLDLNLTSGASCETTSIIVENGKAYGTLPTPTHTSYEFIGWYTAAKGGDKVTSTTVPSSSDNKITLYAHWNTYTLCIGSEFKTKLLAHNPVASIVFTNAVAPSNANLEDLTNEGGGTSVVGWFDATEKTYYISTQSDHKIIFNEDSSGMFNSSTYSLYCESIAFDNIDTSHVKNMSNMFNLCSQLKTLDLSNFDTSSVTDMSNMFSYCTSLTELDISSFNTVNVTNMTKMFYNCSSLNSIYVSSDGFITSNVTSSDSILQNCNSLPNFEKQGVYAPDRGTIKRAISTKKGGYLYVDATVVTLDGNADDVAYWDSDSHTTKTFTSQTLVTQKGYAYSDMRTNIYRYKTSGYTFAGWWTEKDGGIEITNETIAVYNKDQRRITLYAHWSNYNMVDGKTFNGAIPSDATSVVFTNITAPKKAELTDLSTAQGNYVVGWYDEDSKTYYVSTQRSGTSAILNADCSGMFKDKTNLTSISITSADSSNITNMSSMFENTSITSIDVSGLNTSSVTDMSSMFAGCSNLTTLDLNNFKTSKVTNMSNMFAGDSKLETIYASSSNFSTSNVTESTDMFKDCTSLYKFDESSVDVSKATARGAGGYFLEDLKTITFDYDSDEGGTCDIDSITVEQGYALSNYISELPVPTRSGYTFNYWEFYFYPTHKILSLDTVYSYNYDLTAHANWSENNYTLPTGSSFNGYIPDEATAIVFTSDTAPSGTTPTELGQGIVAWLDETTWYVSTQNENKTIKFNDDCSGMFAGKTNLKSITFNNINSSVANVKNMSSMFKGCTSLETLDLKNVMTYFVTDMSSMFEGCTSLTGIYVGSSFSTSAVTSSTNMFKDCTKLPNYDASSVDASKAKSWKSDSNGYLYVNTQTVKLDPNGGTCDVASIQVDRWYEYGDLPIATASESGKGFLGWFTAKEGGKQVYSDTAFSEYDLDNNTLYAHYDDTNVMVTGKVFNRSIPSATTSVVFTSKTAPSGVTTTNLSTVSNGTIVGWLDGTTWYVSSQDSSKKIVFNEDCSGMFMAYGEYYDEDDEDESSSKVASISSVTFDNVDTSNVTDMSMMFAYCTKLTSVDLSSLNTSKVTTMYGLFGGCTSLTSFNLTNLDISSLTDMGDMFAMTSLTDYDLSSFDTSNVTDMSGLFAKCANLKSFKFGDTSKVTDISEMFYGCTGLTSITSDMLSNSNLNTSSVTNMSELFDRCTNLTSVDLSSLDTSKATKMYEMFYKCTSLDSVAFGNTSSVTDMSGMFYGCSKLTSVDVSMIDTTNVTNMANLFNGCSSLTTLDLSSFDTSNVTETSGMFKDCSALTKVVVGSDTDKEKLSSASDTPTTVTFEVKTSGQSDSNNISITSLDDEFDEMSNDVFDEKDESNNDSKGDSDVQNKDTSLNTETNEDSIEQKTDDSSTEGNDISNGSGELEKNDETSNDSSNVLDGANEESDSNSTEESNNDTSSEGDTQE